MNFEFHKKFSKFVNMKQVSLYILGALITTVVILAIQLSSKNNRIKELQQSNNLLEASQDSLRRVWNENLEQWQYERQSFQATNGQLTEYLKEHEQALYDLKNQYNGLVGIISEQETRIDTIVKNDTTYLGEGVRSATVVNPYYTARIKSYPDTTSLSLRVMDSLSYSIDEDGLLITTNKNPYVDIVDQKSFRVVQPEKKKNYKWYIGALGGLIGGYFIFK